MDVGIDARLLTPVANAHFIIWLSYQVINIYFTASESKTLSSANGNLWAFQKYPTILGSNHHGYMTKSYSCM